MNGRMIGQIPGQSESVTGLIRIGRALFASVGRSIDSSPVQGNVFRSYSVKAEETLASIENVEQNSGKPSKKPSTFDPAAVTHK
jgi:hypothetical protein